MSKAIFLAPFLMRGNKFFSLRPSKSYCPTSCLVMGYYSGDLLSLNLEVGASNLHVHFWLICFYARISEWHPYKIVMRRLCFEMALLSSLMSHIKGVFMAKYLLHFGNSVRKIGDKRGSLSLPPWLKGIARWQDSAGRKGGMALRHTRVKSKNKEGFIKEIIKLIIF